MKLKNKIELERDEIIQQLDDLFYGPMIPDFHAVYTEQEWKDLMATKPKQN